MTSHDLAAAFQAAAGEDHEAKVTLIDLVRAFALLHREGRMRADLIEEVVCAAETQIETDQRLKLAHAALLDGFITEAPKAYIK